MRLLADENLPAIAVLELRKRGHDVLWVTTDLPGASDREVLARASADERLVLTFDKDFGELAFRQRLPARCGVVLFRIAMTSPAHVAAVAVATLESPVEWAGSFVVVEEDHLRVTALPCH